MSEEDWLATSLEQNKRKGKKTRPNKTENAKGLSAAQESKKFGKRLGETRVRRASDLTVLAPKGFSKNKNDPFENLWLSKASINSETPFGKEISEPLPKLFDAILRGAL